MTLLVGTYGARTVESQLALLASRAAARCDVIEVRLDYLPDVAGRVAEIVRASGRPVMATCRRAGEGGAFAAGEPARLDLLMRAADAGAAWVDVEDDVPHAEVLRLAGRGAKIVRSLHAPTLPADADGVVDRLLAAPADAAKLVALKANATDVVRLLDLVGRRGERLGAHVSNSPFSRYAGAAMGSFFTYASLRPGGLIPAPIPTVTTTLDRMRFERLRAGAPLFVLVGADVERSVSSDMLNRAFELIGVPTVALRWSCDDPAPALDAIERFGWAGAAVTIPHKERVFELLRARGARLSPEAEETGAVNTVLGEETGLAGTNTDIRGVVEAVRPFSTVQPVTGRTALVIGAGGGARAAVRAAMRLGCGEVVVHARRPESAARLTALRRDDEPRPRRRDRSRGRRSLAVARRPGDACRPRRRSRFDFSSLPQRALVLEMIVTPVRTANESAALAAGHRTASGAQMLLNQAREQVRLLTGRAGDYYEMREAEASALRAAARTIVLVGLRCTGKTESGARLAKLLNRLFLDTDAEVARRTGRTPDEMIRAGEEAAFRATEADVLRDALSRTGTVVATGGGAALHEELLTSVAGLWPVVLLDAADEVLLARWEAAPRAPLSSLSPRDELSRQRAERFPVFRRIAAATLDTSRLSFDDTAESIAALDDSGFDEAPEAA